MITFVIISMAGNVTAQGWGQHQSNERHRADNHRKNHHKDDDRKDLKHHGHHDRDHDLRRGHAHHYDHHYRHDHLPEAHHRHDRGQRPVVVRHHHSRPRYVYYRDYNVYHDLHRDVYISYSGRNWSVSASLPVVLQHVEARRAVRMEVDYHDDDFAGYLERNRPTYTSIYTEF
jgi:hypothetical protein